LNLRQDIFRGKVPAKGVALWWLGQSSFILKGPDGTVLAIDPYLSNACKAVGANADINMDRMVPVLLAPRELVGIDAYLLTHGHEDHLDPQTLQP
jgi:L-ascorbate 6-phosphate lactonase